MGNFKRKKPPSKEVRWGSPKYLQRNRTPSVIRSFKKKPCKYTKGEHEFIFVKKEKMWIYNHTTLRCGCGKRSSILEKITLIKK